MNEPVSKERTSLIEDVFISHEGLKRLPYLQQPLTEKYTLEGQLHYGLLNRRFTATLILAKPKASVGDKKSTRVCQHLKTRGVDWDKFATIDSYMGDVDKYNPLNSANLFEACFTKGIYVYDGKFLLTTAFRIQKCDSCITDKSSMCLVSSKGGMLAYKCCAKISPLSQAQTNEFSKRLLEFTADDESPFIAKVPKLDLDLKDANRMTKKLINVDAYVAKHTCSTVKSLKRKIKLKRFGHVNMPIGYVRIENILRSGLQAEVSFKEAGPNTLEVVKEDEELTRVFEVYLMRMDAKLGSVVGQKAAYLRMLLSAYSIPKTQTATLEEMVTMHNIPTSDYSPEILIPGRLAVYQGKNNELYGVTGFKQVRVQCSVCRKTIVGEKTCFCRVDKAEWGKVAEPNMVNDSVYKIFVYDIESWQDAQGDHHVSMISCMEPSKRVVTFDTTDEFLNHIFQYAKRRKQNPEYRAETIIVAGFNSSRYDDVLITEDYRKMVEQWGMLSTYKYGVKQGSIIFNTCKFSSQVELKFVDILRFTGFPISLKNAAKAFQVETPKGSFPFGVLNDLYQGNAIKLDSNGTYDLSYYNGDEVLKAESDKYFEDMPPAPPGENIHKYRCRIYCENDVVTSRQVLDKLRKMYEELWYGAIERMEKLGADLTDLCPLTRPKVVEKDRSKSLRATRESANQANSRKKLVAACAAEKKYLHLAAQMASNADEFRVIPEKRARWGKAHKRHPRAKEFEVLKFHSSASFVYRLMLVMAKRIPLEARNTLTGKNEKVGVQILAPTNDMYNLLSKSVVGGWVGSAMQGALFHTPSMEKAGLLTEEFDKIVLDEEENPPEDRHLHFTEEAQTMVDIVSHYPSSVTAPMPIGVPCKISGRKALEEFIDMIKNAKTVEEIPPGFLYCTLKPPDEKRAQLTCPPIRTRAGGLDWSYNAENAAIPRCYNSVDLWIGITRFAYRPSLAWSVVDPIFAVVFSHSAPIFKEYIDFARYIKEEGARLKNIMLKTAGKIALNSSIGKLGQHAENNHNVFEEDVEVFLAEHGKYAVLSGSTTHNSKKLEHRFKVTDVQGTRAPVHMASFMYAYSRLIIRDVLEISGGMDCPLDANTVPRPLYGDTDSVIVPSHTLENNPRVADHTKGFIAVYIPPNIAYNYEPEDVFEDDHTFFALGVMARKFYCLVTYNQEKDSFKIKLKSKGHKVQLATDPCIAHTLVNCAACRCSHGKYRLMCANCVFFNLAEVYTSSPLVGASKLTLWEFWRVVMTNVPGLVQQFRFNRTLEMTGAGRSPFTITTQYAPLQVKYATIPGTRHGFWYNPAGS